MEERSCKGDIFYQTLLAFFPKLEGFKDLMPHSEFLDLIYEYVLYKSVFTRPFLMLEKVTF